MLVSTRRLFTTNSTAPSADACSPRPYVHKFASYSDWHDPSNLELVRIFATFGFMGREGMAEHMWACLLGEPCLQAVIGHQLMYSTLPYWLSTAIEKEMIGVGATSNHQLVLDRLQCFLLQLM